MSGTVEMKMSRPTGVTVIAVWYFVGSAVMLSLGAIQFFDAEIDLLPKPVPLLGSAVLIVLGIGLWKMKNWARIATIIGTTVSLLTGLFLRILSQSLLEFSLLGAALDAVTYILNLGMVIYLVRPRVKEAFLFSMQTPPLASSQTQPHA